MPVVWCSALPPRGRVLTLIKTQKAQGGMNSSDLDRGAKTDENGA